MPPDALDEGDSTYLSYVSCAGQSCLAVGTDDYQWDNTSKTWKDVTPSGFAVGGRGLSCGGPTNCMMVSGQLGNAWWNGSTWAYTQFAPSGKFAEFMALSCRGSTCLAVGHKTSGGKQQPIAQRWNGAVWQIIAAPKAPVS